MATKTTKDAKVSVVREGVRLIVPEGMSYADARTWLTRQEEAEDAVISMERTYRAFPLDGAAAFARAVDRLHGWTAKQGTTVAIAQPGGGSINVPWGDQRIPGMEGTLSCGFGKTRDGLPCFRLFARTLEKRRALVETIFEAVQHELDTGSIYRARAVRFIFPDEGEAFDPTTAPEFLDLSHVNPDELIFRADVMELIETTLFTPLRYTAALRTQGIPLKRGILLEGKYGVGKTLLAYATADLATRHGWTYLYARVDQLAQAIEFALLYEPCVIFAEDVDQVVGTDERTARVNDVLNTIDGVNVKGREVMVVLTTNHADTINQAMLRYGRMDTVVSIPPPDADAAARLVDLYARGMLEPNTDLRGVGAELDGQIPAMIREVVERAKLASITRNEGRPGKLSAHDLTIAARGMVRHQALLAPKAIDDRTELERAAGVLGDAVVELGDAIAHGLTQQLISYETVPTDRPAWRASELGATRARQLTNGHDTRPTTPEPAKPAKS